MNRELSLPLHLSVAIKICTTVINEIVTLAVCLFFHSQTTELTAIKSGTVKGSILEKDIDCFYLIHP